MTLPLDMYQFLIQPIRDADRTSGDLFVKRLLQGGQDEWARTQAKIFAIKDLWSLTECPDEFLIYLKNIVGWTPDLRHITDDLSADLLRRLIDASIPFWKSRGPERSIVDMLQLLTGQRCRVWNWFDFRWILEETSLIEDHQRADPWILDLPESTAADDRRFNVRIVDDGSYDHSLIRGIVQLTRPSGERIEITYLAFLDLFLTTGDNFQWTLDTGDEIVVADGQLTMDDSSQEERAVVSVTGANDWSDYVAYARLQSNGASAGEGSMLLFYFTDSSNYYLALVDVPGNLVKLRKVVGGTPSDVVSFDMDSIGATLTTTEWYGLRVEVITEGSTNRIRVYLDGDRVIDTTDAAHSKGTLGVGHTANCTLVCSEVEALKTPIVTETIDINT